MFELFIRISPRNESDGFSFARKQLPKPPWTLYSYAMLFHGDIRMSKKLDGVRRRNAMESAGSTMSYVLFL